MPSTAYNTALFTDIDDTLIARDRDAGLAQAAHDLQASLKAGHTALILVTGAEITAVKKRIRDGEIPIPDAIISEVGTQVWLHTTAGWRQDARYRGMLLHSGYKKSEVILQAGTFIRQYQQGYELQFQPHSKTAGAYKTSLYFMASHAGAAMLARQAREFFAPYKVIVCEEIHYNAAAPPAEPRRKFCLDIVPVTKADAVSYLIERLGITGGFKAGDSGNDVEMLLNPDVLLPILVGGYKPEAHTAISQALTGQQKGPLHTLQDGRTIYIESGGRRAAQSIQNAIALFRNIYGEVAA